MERHHVPEEERHISSLNPSDHPSGALRGYQHSLPRDCAVMHGVPGLEHGPGQQRGTETSPTLGFYLNVGGRKGAQHCSPDDPGAGPI